MALIAHRGQQGSSAERSAFPKHIAPLDSACRKTAVGQSDAKNGWRFVGKTTVGQSDDKAAMEGKRGLSGEKQYLA